MTCAGRSQLSIIAHGCSHPNLCLRENICGHTLSSPCRIKHELGESFELILLPSTCKNGMDVRVPLDVVCQASLPCHSKDLGFYDRLVWHSEHFKKQKYHVVWVQHKNNRLVSARPLCGLDFIFQRFQKSAGISSSWWESSLISDHLLALVRRPLGWMSLEIKLRYSSSYRSMGSFSWS